MGEGSSSDEEEGLDGDGSGEGGEGGVGGLEREAGEVFEDGFGRGFGSEEVLKGCCCVVGLVLWEEEAE